MIIVVGLIILIAALIIGVAGVVSNHGAAHSLAHPFTILGEHFHGSSGMLFLYGIALGAIGLAGLLLLLGGARRTARRARLARSELKEARLQTEAVARDRDELAQAQAQAAREPVVNGTGSHATVGETAVPTGYRSPGTPGDAVAPGAADATGAADAAMPPPPGIAAHRVSS
jgi:type II secretory pathway pseudopilin PulG